MLNYSWTRLVFHIDLPGDPASDDYARFRCISEEADSRTEDRACSVFFDALNRIPFRADLTQEIYHGEDFYVVDPKAHSASELRVFLPTPFRPYRSVLADYGQKKVLYSEAFMASFTQTLFNQLGLEKNMSEHGRLLLHASFIDTGSGAVLFSAPSGTGKSTQAELWRKVRSAEVLNGDRAGLFKENGIWYAGGVPWSGTSGISVNRIVPLKAIFILRQAPENRVEDLPASQKLRALLEQTTINPWNKEMYIRAQQLLLDLVTSVPVLKLSCLPDEGAVKAAADAIMLDHAH